QDNFSKEVFMLTTNENDDEEIEWYVSLENSETSSECSQEEINLKEELMSQFSH
ncbi:1256_t:CDS:1, partial [Funneliformis caledonium]